MNNLNQKFINHSWLPLVLNVVALIGISAVGYFTYTIIQDISAYKNEVVISTKISDQKIANLEAALATTTLTSQELAQRLLDQQNRNSSIESSISTISGTVGTLEKLSKTDKELLQKYSKIYFLSDNYVPMSLMLMQTKYSYGQKKLLPFHTSALPFLTRMIDQASSTGVSLEVASAYRSFGEQSALKSDYLTTYGSGANKFSADQGYSEHQLGTAVDITTNTLTTDPLSIKFDTTPAYTWLTQNAYKYGFILSYPKINTYYQYEPWHWRFVGVALATKIHDSGISFTDMEQRTIDTYLVNIFD